MGLIDSISHHIAQLVINGIGGRHTDTDMYMSWTKSVFRNQVDAGHRTKYTWLKNS